MLKFSHKNFIIITDKTVFIVHKDHKPEVTRYQTIPLIHTCYIRRDQIYTGTNNVTRRVTQGLARRCDFIQSGICAAILQI
jgi:hypothetical protein